MNEIQKKNWTFSRGWHNVKSFFSKEYADQYKARIEKLAEIISPKPAAPQSPIDIDPSQPVNVDLPTDIQNTTPKPAAPQPPIDIVLPQPVNVDLPNNTQNILPQPIVEEEKQINEPLEKNGILAISTEWRKKRDAGLVEDIDVKIKQTKVIHNDNFFSPEAHETITRLKQSQPEKVVDEYDYDWS